MPYTYNYPRPALTADCLIFAGDTSEKYILLIRRKTYPFENMWALPGGFMDMNETIEETAERELKEETGLSDINLSQFRVYSKVDRDPRGRTVTVVFYGDAGKSIPEVKGSSDAENARWFPVDDLPALAFDHGIIINEFINSPCWKKLQK